MTDEENESLSERLARQAKDKPIKTARRRPGVSAAAQAKDSGTKTAKLARKLHENRAIQRFEEKRELGGLADAAGMPGGDLATYYSPEEIAKVADSYEGRQQRRLMNIAREKYLLGPSLQPYMDKVGPNADLRDPDTFAGLYACHAMATESTTEVRKALDAMKGIFGHDQIHVHHHRHSEADVDDKIQTLKDAIIHEAKTMEAEEE